MAFHGLSWKRSQLCILPFYFFHFLLSKKHVFMFGCHWFCHVLSIFWAGWMVVSAAFFVSRGSEHAEYHQNNFKLGGNLTEWHSTGLSPGSVPSLACFLFISSICFSARSTYLCLSAVLCGALRGKCSALPDRSKCINFQKTVGYDDIPTLMRQ